MLLLCKDKHISHLKEQLKERDRSLEQAMELVKNNQLLLLKSQERVLMLESSSIDGKKNFGDQFKRLFKI